MNLFVRLKNLWELSNYTVLNGAELGDELPRAISPKLIYGNKSNKKMATIVEDPVDLFPEEPETI